MNVGDQPLKRFLFASGFDQTLSFNDSGYVLSEVIGVPTREVERKAAGSGRASASCLSRMALSFRNGAGGLRRLAYLAILCRETALIPRLLLAIASAAPRDAPPVFPESPIPPIVGVAEVRSPAWHQSAAAETIATEIPVLPGLLWPGPASKG